MSAESARLEGEVSTETCGSECVTLRDISSVSNTRFIQGNILAFITYNRVARLFSTLGSALAENEALP